MRARNANSTLRQRATRDFPVVSSVCRSSGMCSVSTNTKSKPACLARFGHNGDMATIAEEVDSIPVLERLRSLGIGYAQGHAVASPEPLADPDGEVALPCLPAGNLIV